MFKFNSRLHLIVWLVPIIIGLGWLLSVQTKQDNVVNLSILEDALGKWSFDQVFQMSQDGLFPDTQKKRLNRRLYPQCFLA